MEQINPGNPATRSANIIADNLEHLKAVFPEAFNEGKIDFQVLRQLLGDAVDEGEERYGLNWHGKRRARQLALTPSAGTLRPSPEESVDWGTTQNLMIEGDNLEVLKLLQKSYAGKVKLIYIDPPYNTGGELIYSDRYQDTLDTYLRYTGQRDDDFPKIGSNRESGGRYHTNWISMMYPRVKLAKSMLANDGALCVSISDIELANLRAILDDIFGSENFVNIVNVLAKVSAGASGGGEDKRLKKNIEYVVVYAKNLSAFNTLAHLQKSTPLMDVIERMRDSGESWKYTSILVGADEREHLGTIADGDGNPIEVYKRKNVKRTTVNSVCRDQGITEKEAYTQHLRQIFSDTNAQSSIRARVIEFVGKLDDSELLEVEYVPRSGKDKGQLVTHSYVSNTVRRVIWLSDVAEVEKGEVSKMERLGTYWDHFDYNNVGKEGGVPFPEGKKPISLIQQCLALQKDNNGIVLDFFAGSGSTAHAVLAQNQKDNGRRKFVLVQLPEPISEKREYQAVREFATSAGITPTIFSIARERTRRAAKSIREQSNLYKGDLGFRVFKLDTSNIRCWDPRPDDLEGELLADVDHIERDRTEQDILYELLLKLGLDLCVPIDARIVSGKVVHAIGGGVLITCLGETIGRSDVEPLALGIADLHDALAPAGETTVVFRDSAFGDDVSKTNLLAILEQRGLGNVRSL